MSSGQVVLKQQCIIHILGWCATYSSVDLVDQEEPNRLGSYCAQKHLYPIWEALTLGKLHSYIGGDTFLIFNINSLLSWKLTWDFWSIGQL